VEKQKKRMISNGFDDYSNPSVESLNTFAERLNRSAKKWRENLFVPELSFPELGKMSGVINKDAVDAAAMAFQPMVPQSKERNKIMAGRIKKREFGIKVKDLLKECGAERVEEATAIAKTAIKRRLEELQIAEATFTALKSSFDDLKKMDIGEVIALEQLSGHVGRMSWE